MANEIKNQDKEWYKDVYRFAKVYMVEPDPDFYDYDFWIDYFKKAKVDAVNFGAGGIVAFYPTKIKFQRKSAWMGDGDPFGKLVKAARDMGVRVVCRLDPHATHQEVFDAHPEWIACDKHGNPRRHWARSDLWVTCVMGTYYTDFIADVIREIETEYMVDGFHINRWEGSGICYCKHCKKEFFEFAGKELPTDDDLDDIAWDDYNRWVGKKQVEIWDQLNAVVQSINPNAYFLPNLYKSDVISAQDITKRIKLMTVDYQGRNLKSPVWDMGRASKKIRGLVGEEAKVIPGISPGYENDYRWKDSVRDIPELKMWYYEALANGLDIGWGKFSAVLYDYRWLDPVQEISEWHWANEKYFRSKHSLANVCIVYPVLKKVYPGAGEVEKESEDHELGVYFSLMEARVPFDMLHSDNISVENLSRYKTVILPNICRMSDSQVEAIRQYVKNGGSIIATFETSLYDENGKQRNNFALKDLFGADFVSRRAKFPIKNAYINIEKDSGGNYHPVVKGLENAGRIMHGVRQLELKPTMSLSSIPLTCIPAYPDLPMEDVYPRQPKTDIPEVYIRDFGNGRVIYFPWDVDRIFWEVMSSDHGRLISNSAKWLLNNQLPVLVEGRGLVEVTCRSHEGAVSVHLLNLNNAMTMRGTMHECVPVGPEKVSVYLPQGKLAKDVKLLKKGTPIQFSQNGNLVTVTISEIVDYEVLAVDFE